MCTFNYSSSDSSPDYLYTFKVLYSMIPFYSVSFKIVVLCLFVLSITTSGLTQPHGDTIIPRADVSSYPLPSPSLDSDISRTNYSGTGKSPGQSDNLDCLSIYFTPHGWVDAIDGCFETLNLTTWLQLWFLNTSQCDAEDAAVAFEGSRELNCNLPSEPWAITLNRQITGFATDICAAYSSMDCDFAGPKPSASGLLRYTARNPVLKARYLYIYLNNHSE